MCKDRDYLRNSFIYAEDIPIVYNFIEAYKDLLNDNLAFVLAYAIKTLNEDQLEYLLHMLYEANIQIPSREEISDLLVADK